ncbi:MAG: DJ-1/PfpI family protein [Cellvibrionaceae bacterium]
MTDSRVKKIGIIAFNDVEELDLVGPWEVFSSAQSMSEEITCEVISMDGLGVNAAKGMYFGVHGRMKTDTRYDVLLLPGGTGTRALMKDTAFLTCLSEIASNAALVTSVCSGSLVYAHMGLLDGHDCTTHHLCFEELEKFESLGNIVKDKRYVQSGKYVTSAGVSAGIDMALWILAEITNIEFSKKVQKYIEYYPAPPFSDGY